MHSLLFLLLDDLPSTREEREFLHLTGETLEHPGGRLYESQGDPRWIISEVRKRLLAGATLTAVLIPEFAIRDLREMDLPRSCLVVHAELMSTIPFQEGWRPLREDNLDLFRVLRPVREGMRIEVVEDPESFQESLHSSTPTVIRARLHEVSESPHRWYGSLAEPSVGGAVTLMTLSAFRQRQARHDGEIWLRNPAALGLSFSDDEESLPTLVKNRQLKIHGLSVSLRGNYDSLLDMWMGEQDQEISREALLGELKQLKESGVSTNYAALLTLHAPNVDPQVRIMSGLVVEQVTPFVAQNLVITTERRVIVHPGEIVPIALPAWCMNQDLPSPGGEKIRQTPFILDLAGASSQEGVWSLLEARVHSSQPSQP